MEATVFTIQHTKLDWRLSTPTDEICAEDYLVLLNSKILPRALDQSSLLETFLSTPCLPF